MTKLSLSQIEDSYKADLVQWNFDDEAEMQGELLPEDDLDEAAYRNTYQRKEIRTKRQREEGELVGKGNIRKHRKY